MEPPARLGPFALIDRIGEGGMGVVYRARDTRLDRDVAIKLLRPELLADRDARSRLEREARAVSALNHPNIVALYDVGSDEGNDFIVMEHMTGRTLDVVLSAGRLPLERALDYAIAIADALSFAHARGLIHRDLKPGNVMITPEGRVKLLDFGIAKVLSPTADASNNRLTATGAIVGTPAYMSPEQASNEVVDARSDIFAFGAVLYEMVTGKRAFGAGSAAATLAAVLTTAPPSVRTIAPAAPLELERLVERCLRKDPQRRVQAVSDVRVILEDLREEAGPQYERMMSVPWRDTRGAVRRVGPMAALLVIGAGAGLGIEHWRGRDNGGSAPIATGPVVRLTWDDGLTTQPSISADGKLMAYASDRAGDNLDIWVQQTSGGAAVRITTDPNDDHDPDVSADGSFLVFRSERNGGGIYIVPTLGGDARLIAPGGQVPSLSPDGQSIAFWTGPWLAPRSPDQIRRTYVVGTGGGEPVQVAKKLQSDGDPVWSPDGRSLLVFGRGDSGDGTVETDWWWVPIDGTPPARTGAYDRMQAAGITTDGSSRPGLEIFPYPEEWSDEGVLFSGGQESSTTQQIWILPLSARTGRASGLPRRVTGSLGFDTSPSFAADGVLVFSSEDRNQVLITLPLDANAGRATGEPTLLSGDYRQVGRSSISLDGRTVVFPVLGFAGAELWLRDVPGRRERQIAVTPPTRLNPILAPDGGRVAYTVAPGPVGGDVVSDGYVLRTDGGTPRKVCTQCQMWAWLSDSRTVIAVNDSPRVIIAIEVESGRRQTVLSVAETLVPKSRIVRVLVSPDDRWLSFRIGGGTFLAPFRADAPPAADEWRQLLSGTPSGERVAGWSPDSRLLYLLLERDGFRCLYSLSMDPRTGEPVGEPVPVYHFHNAGRQWGSTGFGSAVVNGTFLAMMLNRRGNIWKTDLRDRDGR